MAVWIRPAEETRYYLGMCFQEHIGAKVIGCYLLQKYIDARVDMIARKTVFFYSGCGDLMKTKLCKKRKKTYFSLMQEELKQKCPICAATLNDGFIVCISGLYGKICPECYELLQTSNGE